MSTLRSAGGKGSLYTDASWRTAAIRKNAILKGQIQKGGSGGSMVTLPSIPMVSDGSGGWMPDSSIVNGNLLISAIGAMIDNIAGYNTGKSMFISNGGAFPVTITITNYGAPGQTCIVTLTGNFTTDSVSTGPLSCFFLNDYTQTSIITMSYGSGSGNILSAENQAKKPLISEHHLQKGFTSGVMEAILGKNKNGFI